MRRCALLPLLIVLAGAAAAPGQEWARKMFSETRHDFGPVARGSKAQFRFKFKNIYEEPLHVSGVRSSCSCTTPEVTKKDLKTWETGEVVANFNTNALLGPQSATLTVTFDKPFPAEVQLQVTGNIRGDVVLQPGMVELGTIDAGRGAERRISLTHTGRSDWTISDVRSANTNFEVEVNETRRTSASVVYDLVVRLKPTSPAGYINDQLFLITNDSSAPQIPIDVEGSVVASVEVRPTSLSFGAVAPGQSVPKNIVVRNSNKRPFRVLQIIGDNCFSYKLPTEAREMHSIPITFTAGQQPGTVVKRIKIKTDLGENVVLDVTCHAKVLEPSESSTAAGKNSGAVQTGFRGE